MIKNIFEMYPLCFFFSFYINVTLFSMLNFFGWSSRDHHESLWGDLTVVFIGISWGEMTSAEELG